MAWHVEHTDTFAGEANYCWVRRYTIPGNPTKRALIRRAKAYTGLTGVRCRVEYYFGDGYALYPQGMAQVVFVQWVD